MAVRVAYGASNNLEEAIASGKIPPGAFIVTEEKGELYFYDSTGKLERIVSKDWVEAILKEEQLRAEAEANRQAHEDERETSEKARSSWGKYDSLKRYVPGNKVTLNGSSFVCVAACQGVSPLFTGAERTIGEILTAAANADRTWYPDSTGTLDDLKKLLTDYLDALALQDSSGKTYTSSAADVNTVATVLTKLIDDANNNGAADYLDQNTFYPVMTWKQVQYYLINGTLSPDTSIPAYNWYPAYIDGGNWLVLAAKGDEGKTGPTGATGARGQKGDKGDKGNTPEISHLELYETYCSENQYLPGNKVSYQGSCWVCKRPCKGIPPTVFDADAETVKLTRMMSDYLWSMGSSTRVETLTALTAVVDKLAFQDASGTTYTSATVSALLSAMEAGLNASTDMDLFNATDYKAEFSWHEMQYYLINGGTPVTDESGLIPGYSWKFDKTNSNTTRFNLDAEVTKITRMVSSAYWGADSNYTNADVEQELSTYIADLNLKGSDGAFYTASDAAALRVKIESFIDNIASNNMLDTSQDYAEATWDELQYYLLTGNVADDESGTIPSGDYTWKPLGPEWLLLAAKGEKGETGPVGPTGAKGQKGDKGDMPDISALYVWEAYDPQKEYIPGNKVTLNGNSFVCKKACQGVSPSKDVNVDVTAKAWMRAAAQGQAALEAAMTDADIVAMKLSKDSTGTSFYTAADKTTLAGILMAAHNNMWGLDPTFTFIDMITVTLVLPWDNMQCYLLNGTLTDGGNESSYAWKPTGGGGSETFDADAETVKLTRMISDYLWTMGSSTQAETLAALTAVVDKLAFRDASGTTYTSATVNALLSAMEAGVNASTDMDFFNTTDYKAEFSWNEMQYYLINGGTPVTDESGTIPIYGQRPDAWLLIAAKGDEGRPGADGHPPRKGVDYFTEADITAIVDLVLARLAEQKEAGV